MTTHTTQQRTFLVVDDEPLIRMEMVELIREHGFEACEAGTTAEALKILEQDAEGIVGLITDVNMPGSRSGMVLANHVRVIWPHIRIIVVSGGRKPFAGELPDNTAFIAKPWRPDDLVTALAMP
jgi:DNA-binding NtrC family response regulator